MVRQGKRLYRSRTDRRLAGVLGGIAEYFGIDPSIVRIIYVLGTIFTGVVPGTALYLITALIVPRAPASEVG